MSTQQIRVIAPAPVVMPRGARWAADAALWLIALLPGRQRDANTTLPAKPVHGSAA